MIGVIAGNAQEYREYLVAMPQAIRDLHVYLHSPRDVYARDLRKIITIGSENPQGHKIYDAAATRIRPRETKLISQEEFEHAVSPVYAVISLMSEKSRGEVEDALKKMSSSDVHLFGGALVKLYMEYNDELSVYVVS